VDARKLDVIRMKGKLRSWESEIGARSQFSGVASAVALQIRIDIARAEHYIEENDIG
jgi:hypothetical protein